MIYLAANQGKGWRPLLCARHVVNLGGGRPLRAVMTGTAS